MRDDDSRIENEGRHGVLFGSGREVGSDGEFWEAGAINRRGGKSWRLLKLLSERRWLWQGRRWRVDVASW